MFYSYIDTPAGTLLLTGDGNVITGVHWKVFARTPVILPDWAEDERPFRHVVQQLEEYFAGTRREFDFAYVLKGTAFQQRVWQELAKIPYGSNTSYSAIATAVGNPKAVRAVGTAVGSNPISIAVPCHRVLTSTRGIGGYAGGIPAKLKLLDIEHIPVRIPKALVS